VKRARRGRLIALDGGAVGLAPAVKEIVKALAAADVPRGVSAWDASGIFTELFATDAIHFVSARTMTLLYAADLAFRLRWQIVPSLAEGRFVIAAPYVETAKAFGVAAGLPRKWLDELFRFAPKPDSAYHVSQRSHPHAAGTPRGRVGAAASQGYFDCFSTTLRGDDDFRKRSLEYLASLERRRRCVRLTAASLTTVARQR
jgi:hypothetical protein